MVDSGTVMDRFVVAFTQGVIRFRYLVVLAMIVVPILVGSGAGKLQFSSDYRVFFSGENEDLENFEKFQEVYTKNDNFLFVVVSSEGDIYTKESLSAVKKITDDAWQIPFANRVDSLANFQHSYSEDDDLVVEELIGSADDLNSDVIQRLRHVADSEPLIKNSFINASGTAAAINVTLQYPGDDLSELPKAVAKAREIKADIEEKNPGLRVYLTGFSMLNNAFSEAGFMDTVNLMPVMFLVFLLALILTLRSFFAVLTTVVVVLLSMMVAMGVGGWSGVLLTPISNSAPIIVLTLAVADVVHILFTMKKLMRRGVPKREALIDAMRINFVAVSVTSLTTVIGFMSLHFADSPPYWHLANMASAGIVTAWLLSLTLLPALVSFFPVSVKTKSVGGGGRTIWDSFSFFVIRNAKAIVVVGLVCCVALASLIPTVKLEDSWSDYFSENIEFRRDTDQATKSFGLYPIEYSIPAIHSQGISRVEYLDKLEEFTEFLRAQDNVAHVYSMSDVFKKLNKNMHGDDESFYRLPDSHEEAAQYLLLYELSLPYGQDLNDRVNIDKSATRITVTMNKVTTKQTIEFIDATNLWMESNLPGYMQARPTSGQVMFSYIAERNVKAMVSGTLLAFFLIAIIMMVVLGSFGMGLISLIPNCLPVVAAFGVWTLINGAVGFSVAAIASISLGIVVDDTVHLLVKYSKARKEKGFSVERAIAYALNHVGSAILINTFVLVAGFAVMANSNFKVSADMGALTLMTIAIAAILDFLLLPAFIYLVCKRKEAKKVMRENDSSALAKAATSVGLVVVMLGVLSFPERVMAGSGDVVVKNGFDIFARSDRSDRDFKDSRVELKMSLENSAGEVAERTLQITTLEVADEGVGDKSLVVFGTPLDIQGTSLLSHAKILDADDQWVFLPSIKRVKRISSKNKSGPFVGSEFAFEDITGLELNKYAHEYLLEEACGELFCDVVKSVPQYEYSGYSFLKIWIDQDEYQIRQVEYYDRRGDLLKTLTMANYKKYGDVWRPQVMSMVNHLTNKGTTLAYGEYEFNMGLSDADFSKGRLGRN